MQIMWNVNYVKAIFFKQAGWNRELNVPVMSSVYEP